MASLNNVLMWSEKEWIPITAEEAVELHPGGSVSAHAGLFRCKLCRQNVTLVYGDYQVPHFRHSAYEKEKDCPERRLGPNYTIDYVVEKYELPIRIINITPTSFGFEMGFVRVPLAMLTPDLRITITSVGNYEHFYQHARERIDSNGITYLNIGDTPSEGYRISLSNADERLYNFWPQEVTGIDNDGALFDASSRIKMTDDSDVVVGKKYLLLRPGTQNLSDEHIEFIEISKKRISNTTWHLYEVCANDYDESVARFFWDYHCRLTEKPVQLQVVWPRYIKSPYLIKHDGNDVYLYMTGDAKAKAFPDTDIKSYACGSERVLSIDCKEKQQLISAGRTKTLKYTYFWKEELRFKSSFPNVIVKDVHGNEIKEGEINNLPAKQLIDISSDYDGFIICFYNNKIADKREITANTTIELDNIRWNNEVQVYIGKDCIWKGVFKKRSVITNDEIRDLLIRIKSMGGPYIKCPHSVRNMAVQIGNNNELNMWFKQCLNSDRISRKAYRELQTYITNHGSKDSEVQK